jgi:hypothetical protein
MLSRGSDVDSDLLSFPCQLGRGYIPVECVQFYLPSAREVAHGGWHSNVERDFVRGRSAASTTTCGIALQRCWAFYSDIHPIVGPFHFHGAYILSVLSR